MNDILDMWSGLARSWAGGRFPRPHPKAGRWKRSDPEIVDPSHCTRDPRVVVPVPGREPAGESCRTPLMDFSKIAPPSTSAALLRLCLHCSRVACIALALLVRVHSQPAIAPNSPERGPMGRSPLESWELRRLPRLPPVPAFANNSFRQCFLASLAFGSNLPRFESRSALVVPPDFGGFLRAHGAGLLRPAADHGVRLVSGLL